MQAFHKITEKVNHKCWFSRILAEKENTFVIILFFLAPNIIKTKNIVFHLLFIFSLCLLLKIFANEDHEIEIETKPQRMFCIIAVTRKNLLACHQSCIGSIWISVYVSKTFIPESTWQARHLTEFREVIYPKLFFL